MSFWFKSFFLVIVLNLNLFCQTIDLTKEEKQWLKDNPHIKFPVPKNQPPLSMLDKNGKLIGIFPDIFSYLSQEIGQKIELSPVKITDYHKKAKSKGFYGHCAIFNIKQNQKEYLYTKPYMSTPFVIYTKREKKAQIKDVQDLKNKKIVILKEQRAIKEYLEKIENTQIIVVNSPLKQMEKVISNEADAMVGYITYQYLINKYLIADLTIAFISKMDYKIYMGINPQDKPLKSILDKAINNLTEEKINLIASKWNILPNVKEKNQLVLNKDEKKWLKNHKTIKLASSRAFFPFEDINDKNIYEGISADYIKLIEKRLGITFIQSPNKPWNKILKMAEDKKLDLLTAVVPTKKTKESFYFTKPYISHPMMIITSNKTAFIDGMKGLKNKTIAIEKNYFSYELIKARFPYLNLKVYDNSLLALKAVSMEKVDAYIGNIARVDYLSQKNGITNLKISGETPFRLNLAFGVNKDLKEFIPILQKALDSITQEEENKIYKKWISIKQETIIDYSLFWKSIFISVLILLIVLYWNQKLKKEIIRRKKIEKELEELNKTLEQKVENQVYKNKAQQAIMFHQSRLAQMGEMISMIAHQWRQPLNNVSTMIQTVVLKYKKDKLNNEVMEKFNTDVLKQIKYMSQTIDDFKDFFQPRRKKEEFELCDIIKKSVSLIKPIKNINVNLEIDCKNTTYVYGYKNELGQAVLNILNNSKDAFEQCSKKDKWIKITTQKTKNQFFLNIEDNAGGIKKEIFDKVFDPYFSTKLNKNGTGLGLYMTKVIIEDYIKGTIKLENTKEGLLTSITINFDSTEV
ncbi:transporter substrate-binding domain-containing protein [Halarcobacter anaerophilus]|uniref:histidine kinase n=1 Tax=Halarcobacter anaerophilus TaxID=877500 RepID=A0A4Q0XY45_9BACT|nr:transporter substrate-binding domain-containing protein [Halarcobacter anaerophilus]QDF28339.1 periplasmic substrate-binding protein [Halarcobacter anaerophilus]RXJ61995.1 hypothetical protein CRV06_11205 [Halarcobacter anaerophilus]